MVLYITKGILTVGAIALLASLCGIPPVSPILGGTVNRDKRLHVTLIDCACIVTLLSLLVLLVWNYFPDTDKVDAAIHIGALAVVATTWWFILSVAMSRRRIAPVRRALLQLIAIPSFFLSPFFVLNNALIIMNSQRVRPTMNLQGEVTQIGLFLFLYGVSIPVVRILVRVDAQSPYRQACKNDNNAADCR